MNYIEKNEIEHYELLKKWIAPDLPGNPSMYCQLVTEAERLSKSRKEGKYISTDDENGRELLGLFYTSLLDTPSFTDEPPLPYLDWGKTHEYAVEARYVDGYLEFSLSVGFGSCVMCKYVKKTKLPIYTYDRFYSVLSGKYQIHAKHARTIRKVEKERVARKSELDKTLAAVNAASALMEIYGLKLDKESRDKVDGWKKEHNEIMKNMR